MDILCCMCRPDLGRVLYTVHGLMCASSFCALRNALKRIGKACVMAVLVKLRAPGVQGVGEMTPPQQ
jgi:hypothetical protein